MKTLSNELATDLYNYIVSDITLKDKVREIFNIKSVVTDGRNYFPFIGNGCGITYLNIDRRNKKSVELREIIYEVYRAFEEFAMLKYFSNDELIILEKMGTPARAVLQQDITIQQMIYDKVIEYAKNVLKIKRISYTSNLD